MARWGAYMGFGEYVCIWPGCYHHSLGVDDHDEHVLFSHLEDEAISILMGMSKRIREEDGRVKTITADPATQQAVLARWEFLQSELLKHKALGSNPVVIKALQDRLDGVIAEGVKHGIPLPGPMPGPEDITGKVNAEWKGTKDLIKLSREDRLAAVKEYREQRRVENDRKKAHILASSPLSDERSPSQSKPKSHSHNPARTPHPCHDGCGGMTGSNFIPGHDSKYKSLVLQVERGKLEPTDPRVLMLVGSDEGPLVWEPGPEGRPRCKNSIAKIR